MTPSGEVKEVVKLKKNVSALVGFIMLMPLLLSCQNIVDGNMDFVNDVELSNTADNYGLIPMHSPIDDTEPVLDPEIELKLREAYRLDGGTPDDIWVVNYVGNYSGCEVLYIGYRLLFNAIMRGEEAAGYTIVIPEGKSLKVYKDSNFYSLSEAYNLGLINKGDVYQIGKLGGYNFIEQYPTPP